VIELNETPAGKALSAMWAAGKHNDLEKWKQNVDLLLAEIEFQVQAQGCPYPKPRDWPALLTAMVKRGAKIPEPPCRWCQCFDPQGTYAPGPLGRTHDGYRLCWREKQHPDFSCYVPRDREE